MAAAGGVYRKTANLGGKHRETGQRPSDQVDGPLHGLRSEPAVGAPGMPPPAFPPDVIAKYSDRTAAQLELELEVLDKLIERKYVALLNARHADGTFTVVRARPAGSDGGYQFMGGGNLFQAFFAVAGSPEVRHYVELPVDEYPEIYALRDEATYLYGLIQQGKANK